MRRIPSMYNTCKPSLMAVAFWFICFLQGVTHCHYDTAKAPLQEWHLSSIEVLDSLHILVYEKCHANETLSVSTSAPASRGRLESCV